MTLNLNSPPTADAYDLKDLAGLMGEPDRDSPLWTPIERPENRPVMGQERLRLKVTADHVRQGEPYHPQHCPVALAVCSAVYRDLPVTVETTTFTTHFHGAGRQCTQYLHEPALALAIMDYDTYRVWKAPPGRDYEMVRLDAVNPDLTLQWLLESRLRHFDRQLQALLDAASPACAP